MSISSDFITYYSKEIIFFKEFEEFVNNKFSVFIDYLNIKFNNDKNNIFNHLQNIIKENNIEKRKEIIRTIAVNSRLYDRLININVRNNILMLSIIDYNIIFKQLPNEYFCYDYIDTNLLLINYNISDMSNIFTDCDFVTIINQIFTKLQFVKISINNNIKIDELKPFQYCFYKVETIDDLKNTDIMCDDIDKCIGVKAMFVMNRYTFNKKYKRKRIIKSEIEMG